MKACVLGLGTNGALTVKYARVLRSHFSDVGNIEMLRKMFLFLRKGNFGEEKEKFCVFKAMRICLSLL